MTDRQTQLLPAEALREPPGVVETDRGADQVGRAAVGGYPDIDEATAEVVEEPEGGLETQYRLDPSVYCVPIM